MLAKFIVHARTRRQALDRLRVALDATNVLGVRTNLRFLRWLFDARAMRAGEMRTDTIATLELPAPPITGREHWQAAAVLLGSTDQDPWADGWRLNQRSARRIRLGDEERNVTLDAAEGTATAVRDGCGVHVDVEGQSLEFSLAPAPTIEDAVQRVAASSEGTATLTAPMPGRVIAVRAAVGASVQAHQPVIIIEAMKMEHAVVAPMDGTLASLGVAEGQQVRRGDVLAELRA